MKYTENNIEGLWVGDAMNGLFIRQKSGLWHLCKDQVPLAAYELEAILYFLNSKSWTVVPIVYEIY